MTVRISTGIQRKVGLENYGSLGASCHVEIEVDQASIEADPDRFGHSVREAFARCQRAVDEQLSQQHSAQPHVSGGVNRFNGAATNGSGMNGGSGSAANGSAYASPRPNPRPATEKQVKAIRAIAGRQRITLHQLLRERFGVSQPDDLSISEASTLIDELKETAASAS